MEISVKVERLLMDPFTNPRDDSQGDRRNPGLPIWIGHYEAGIIAALLEEIALPGL